MRIDRQKLVVGGVLAGASILVPTVSFSAATAYGLLRIQEYKARIPKVVLNISRISLLTSWLLAGHGPHAAQALVFNRIKTVADNAFAAFGVAGLQAVPNYVYYFVLLLGVLVVGGAIIGWLGTRHGDEEAQQRNMNNFMRILMALVIGDLLLALMGV